MKRILPLFWILLVFSLVLPGLAQSKRKLAVVELKVLKMDKTSTANPEESLYELTIQFTNRGEDVVQFNNNQVALVDENGKRHVVTRLRNREVLQLAPGQSQTADRMYYQLPNQSKPASVQLILGRHVAGEAKL
ncbi:MAG: hypothetical protein AB1758_16790 [Candidatus Eremiobacterota bacterium]